MGRGSTTLKGPSSQDPARSWPANVNAIHTMAKTLTLEYAGETLNPKSSGGGSPRVLRRGSRGQGQHYFEGPYLARPSEIVAGACEGDSHNGIDPYTFICRGDPKP